MDFLKTDSKGGRSAFTLIELLIVVAIIAILAAIAVPNFLEAQTRSKVSRVRSDLRTLAVAITSYSVDNNRFPRISYFGAPYNDRFQGEIIYNTLNHLVTSPIAYISNIPFDTFAFRDAVLVTDKMFQYGEVNTLKAWNRAGLPYPPIPGLPGYVANYGTLQTVRKMERYMGAYYLWSHAPLGVQFESTGDVDKYFLQYDPTNGTVSEGRIYIAQKFSEFREVIPPTFDTAN